MPIKAKELGADKVRKLSHPTGAGNPVPFAVGGVAGLMLQVTPNGSKSWVLRVTIRGKRREMGLGPYPEVGLKKAREEAAEIKAKVRKGGDPFAERDAAKRAAEDEARRRVSFAQAVEQFLAAKWAGNEKQRRIIGNRLRDYAIPVFGDTPVADIKTMDVLQALEPIWLDKHETASRTRSYIENVLSWATVKGLREGDNPARWAGNLKELLPKVSKVDAHRPALQAAQAADWFADVSKRDGMGAQALLFTALTAARSGEVRGMTWDEVDLEAGLWTVPAARMKMKRDHRVPLSDTALALLKALPRLAETNLVFPSPTGKAMSDATMGKVMKSMGYLDATTKKPAVVHGLRSTFRVWTAEQGFARDMAEIALAHQVGSDVERAYMRSDMLDRRRAMMQAWAGHLTGTVVADKVVNLHAG